jgi:hypothetical protein
MKLRVRLTAHFLFFLLFKNNFYAFTDLNFYCFLHYILDILY